MVNNEMSREEINAWTSGPWDCVCGKTEIDGSFGCPACGLTVLGSNMERRRRSHKVWVALTEEVNDAIRNERLQELINLRDKINEVIAKLQNV